MNLNSLQLLGLALVIVAVGGQAFVPGAMVYYSTVSPSMIIVPSNTTPNTPQYIPADNDFNCMVMLQGIQTGEVLNASVQISSWTGTAWSVIGTHALTYYQTVNGVLQYVYDFVAGGAGILYALSYAVVTIDVGSFTGIGYIQTAVLAGYFAINGVMVNSTSILRVSSPTLAITYTVTSTGLTGIALSGYIKVYNGSNYLIQTVQMTSPDIMNPKGNLTASYTLPGAGTYTLNGFISYSGTTYQQMSIVDSWGDINSAVQSASFSELYLIMGIAGVVFILVGARKKQASAKV